MSKFRPLLAASIAASLLVSACQVADNSSMSEGSATGIVNASQSRQEETRWKITGNSRTDTNTAISALQVGKAEEARKLLQSATQQGRVDSRAVSLLKQIDTGPNAFFGENYFEYTVNTGEFLSTISKRFLGDPLLFFALARYNGIENPSRINAGMTIRIPGERPEEGMVEADSDSNADSESDMSSELAVTEDSFEEELAGDVALDEELLGNVPVDEELGQVTESVEVVDNALSRILQLQSLYESQDYQMLLDMAQTSPKDEREKFWIEDSALTLSLRQERKGNYPAALATINRGIELIGTYDSLVDSLSLVTDKNEADLLLVEALKGGSSLEQYTLLQRAEEIHPSVSAENDNYTALREQLINQFHKEAMLAFRQQRLAEAIELWEQVLDLDSNNELAIVHKARAENLQKKLKDIN
jgi:tetratricopeptide (TPR) repeat protein